LCTCNGARFLDEQMQSLCEQEGVAEIVVVDDASSDGTWGILLRHSWQDTRIRLYQNQMRLGVSRNFQRALSLARTPWIALADQDDIWLPHKLARMRAGWDGHSDLIHHASHKFHGTLAPKTLPAIAGERRKFSGSDARRLFYRNTIVGHATVVRAELVRRLMPFPAEVPHDWWIGAGAAVKGEVQYVDEYLVHYRIHNSNAYHSSGSRWYRLRTEHYLRVQLLQALVVLPNWSEQGRIFATEYLRLLLAAMPGKFSWPLWQFYRRNAGLLFGGADRRLPRFTRWRKSFSATVGAMAQKSAPAGGERIGRPSVAVGPARPAQSKKAA
jgi:glycosyltransferase involved in cell wall biosynthesis